MNLKLIATVLSIAVPGVAFAGSLSGTVQDVTAETMPGYVAFKLSSMPQYCQPPYNYLAFWGDPDTVKAVYAMLMAAVVSGKAVWVWYDDSNQCHVTAVHGVY
jgi:hypothetical protein